MADEIIEQPQESEVYERLPQPKNFISKNFNEVKKWRSRIEAGIKIRDEELKDLGTLIDYYEGKQWDDSVINLKDKSTINLIFSNIKKELPELYFQNPTPIVQERHPKNELNAFAMQELLKSYTKNNLGTKLKKHVRLCILDAKFKYGCIKSSYTPMFSDNPRAGYPVIAGIDELNRPIFVKDEQGNILLEDDVILTHELYHAERVSPREIIIDPKCRNFIETADWVAHEIVKPLIYLQKNKLYSNTEYLKPNVELSGIFKDYDKKNELISAARVLSDDEDVKLVKFYEIYDFKNNKLICLPDGEDFFIRENALFINPFSFLKFNESPDKFIGPSDIAQAKPLQQEINIGRSLMVTHARRSARKYYYGPDTFRGIDPDKGIEAMESPDDMTLVEIADYNEPPEPIKTATQDSIVFSNLIQSKIDFNEVAGSTEAQRGQSERRKTGEEARYQESYGALRRGDKQNLVAEFITDVYSTLGKLMQETLTIPQAVKIIGPSGIFWAEIKPEDLGKDEFTYDINVSEMRPNIPEFEKQEIIEFINAISAFLNTILSNPVGPMIFNVQGLIKEFSKSYPNIDVDKILNGQITPNQIAMFVIQQQQQQQQGQIQNGNSEDQ